MIWICLSIKKQLFTKGTIIDVLVKQIRQNNNGGILAVIDVSKPDC